ncbi:hypothetical protein CL617_05400 [archaeon]|nr:hypothetical protein [archaeon]|tara:strand:+ start:2387 stop:2701 length:315 start_codon:yes stop_codon:yes gene_type:complete
MEENNDNMQLGGNIQLIGFNELEPAKLIVVKKMVGNYVKKIEDKSTDFQEISVHLKKVHNSEFQIKTKAIIAGKPFNSELTDFNLFIGLDKTLGRVLEEIDNKK